MPSYTVNIPTICVGNVAVGGTGKTPHVEYLLRLLSPSYKVAVLSRGYGRRTRGFVLADESSTAETIGDEPMQIHRKFPAVPMAVSEDRVRGIHRLQQLVADLQVIILDDAFQHRRLRCGFYILLTASDRLYVNDHYLPSGRLRDNRVQVQRANMVVVTKCPPDMRPIDRRVIGNELHLPTYQSLYFSTVAYPSIIDIQRTDKILVLTGIAHPEYLLEHVRKNYLNVELLAFADHHTFSKRDIRRVEERAAVFDWVLTTEKDAERLALSSVSDALRKKIKTVPIRVKLTDEELFREQIFGYIDRQASE